MDLYFETVEKERVWVAHRLPAIEIIQMARRHVTARHQTHVDLGTFMECVVASDD
jgi:hypothetical protein